MDEKRVDRRVLALILGIAVLALIFSGWRNLRKGIYLGSDFFFRAEETLYQRNPVNYIRTVPADSGIDFTIVLNGVEQSANLQRDGDFVSITFDDGTVFEGAWNGQWFYDKQTGLPMEFGGGVTVVVGNQIPPIRKPAISNALCRIAWGDLEQRGHVSLLFVGGLLYALGAVTFLFPNEAHFFLRRWAYQNAELSETGLFMEKAGGVVGMVVGVAVMMGLFIF